MLRAPAFKLVFIVHKAQRMRHCVPYAQQCNPTRSYFSRPLKLISYIATKLLKVTNLIHSLIEDGWFLGCCTM
jgi:hypothetical protein